MGQYFGTDGMRGQANTPPLTAEMVLRLAHAVAHVFAEEGPMRPSVVIGKDTRLSGYMFESALQAGFTSAGFYCLLAGVVPTPAVAQLTRSLRANVGVMVSASHNLYQDNGLKLFGNDGHKLSDELTRRIEALMDTPHQLNVAAPKNIGRAVRIDDAAGRYIESCKASLPRDFKLDSLKVVVDCANGAAYKIAPKIFWEMGAEVVRIHSDPDGININAGCGATMPESIAQAVKTYKADLGIALDGDGDRLILADETGAIIDGDQIMAVIASHMQEKGLLKGGAVALTEMSNMGLVDYLSARNIASIRTPVGDRHVVEAMRAHGLNFGGEQAGHLVFLDHGTTGDGVTAALQFLYVMRYRQIRASELGQAFVKYPQLLRNIPLKAGLRPEDVLARQAVEGAVAEAKTALGESGRIFIRPSGTEPLIRVMVEAVNEVHAKTFAERIVGTIEANMT